MATTAENTAEAMIVGGNTNVIEDMISNLKLDIEARDEQTKIKEEATEFISDADERIRNGGQALSFMTDYMTDEQIETVNGLDIYYEELEASPERGRLNEVAQVTLEIVKKSKEGKITNGELYEKYKEQVEKTEDAPVKYTQFNIKNRSLFSNERLLREVPEDAASSRDHIIKINGFKAGK